MITYKRITKENQEELTTELLEQIYKIDTLSNQDLSFETYFHGLKLNIKEKCRVYLIQNNKKLLGGAIINGTTNNTCELNEIFVDPNLKKQGIGTKLLFHIIADIRANTNYESINLVSLNGTNEILDKLIGKRKIENNKIRDYKTKKFKYTIEINKKYTTKINIIKQPKLFNTRLLKKAVPSRPKVR